MVLGIYKQQCLKVQWNQTTSNEFSVSNDVKEGGVISPLLFCVYIDDLLLQLKASGVGCYVGPYYYGSLGYAGDIVLLNCSVCGTNKMLRICEDYACEHSIRFNAVKSKVIVFSQRGSAATLRFTLNGEKLECTDMDKHLGHMLSNCKPGFLDVSYIKNKFTCSVNMLFADFGNISSSTLYKLFEQYCKSFYGLSLCKLSSSDFNELEVLYRKCIVC